MNDTPKETGPECQGESHSQEHFLSVPGEKSGAFSAQTQASWV